MNKIDNNLPAGFFNNANGETVFARGTKHNRYDKWDITPVENDTVAPVCVDAFQIFPGHGPIETIERIGFLKPASKEDIRQFFKDLRFHFDSKKQHHIVELERIGKKERDWEQVKDRFAFDIEASDDGN